ncbi:ABC transporter substrate-binding protein [Paraburkholderia sp. IW21]|uniref:ABC transporter substrate-binding protein n=1 Tax=Paraburkholderia sp. IW21 TaxID=3242488 RepID=UPI0035206E29
MTFLRRLFDCRSSWHIRSFGMLILWIGTLLALPVMAVEPFKIVGIVALSGTYGIYGDDMRKGLNLAVAQRRTVLGRPIQVVWEDTQSKADVASQKAIKAASSGADLIFGSVASSETLALEQISESRKIPLLITQSSADAITAKPHRYVFRTREKFSNEVLMVQHYIEKNKSASVYAVVADASVFREGWAEIQHGLTADGVALKGSDIVPFGATDYSVVVGKAAASGANTLVLFLAGSDAVTFIKQAAAVRLMDHMRVVGPTIMDDSMAKAAGDAALGVVSAVGYHYSIDNDANRKFVSEYRKSYSGTAPSFGAGEAYEGVNWMLDVIERTHSSDPEVWIAAMEKSDDPSSIEGAKRMRWCDHQADRVSYMVEGVKGSGVPPELKIIGAWTDSELGQKPCPVRQGRP